MIVIVTQQDANPKLNFIDSLFPQGALIGAHLSIVLTMYVAFRSQAAQTSGELHYEPKPTSTEGCSYSFIPKNSTVNQFESDDSFHFHHISYMYFSFLGSVLTVIFAFVVTLIDGDTDPSTVDAQLLAPFIGRYFRKDVEPVEDITMEQMMPLSDLTSEADDNGFSKMKVLRCD